MKYGFTLLELSIVLVIIGLIIGGITAGADLIRSAELNSFVSQINKYRVAHNTFRLKYHAVPGDMKDAYNYWLTECHNDATRCNGNGDGKTAATGATCAAGGQDELFMYWKHLSLANLMSGSYDGIGCSTTANNWEENTPISQLNNGTTLFKQEGAIISSGTQTRYLTPALDNIESRIIDNKFDDDAPLNGNIISAYARPPSGSSFYNSGCYDEPTNSYILSTTNLRCNLKFIGF